MSLLHHQPRSSPGYKLITGFPKYVANSLGRLPVGFDPDGALLLWWDGHLARYSTGRMPTKAFKKTPSRKITAEGIKCVTELTKQIT
jgi:hypothetical protein